MQKAFRIGGIVAILIVIFAAIFVSTTTKTPNADLVWDEAMTVGNMDADNYFIIYSDIACPYCIAFENAILENQEAFESYIEQNDILVEVRLSDFLYEYGESRPISSRYSAVASYCAKREGRFWDYYNLAVDRVWNGFYKSLGKAGFAGLNALDEDYWIALGKEIGLGDEFESCTRNKETLGDVVANAAKSAKAINGMPYFKFNKYVSSGFDLSWGWEYVLMYFDSGLKKK